MSVLLRLPGSPGGPWSAVVVKGAIPLTTTSTAACWAAAGTVEPGGEGPAGRAACMSGRRAVTLICAGWLPQDGLFGWKAPLV